MQMRLPASDVPPEAERLIARLRALKVGAGAPQVGERIPAFMLPNAEGELVSSDELLAQSPLAIAFVRGHWCYLCAEAMHRLQASEREIAAAGGRLVVITPEIGGRAAAIKHRHALSAEVLADVDGGVALSFNLLFHLNEEMQALYRRIGYDLPSYQGHDGWLLPVPASFVVDRGGVVRFAHVEVDYYTRPDPQELIAALRALA